MKILMINKFLHPAGGAETYVFELGKKFSELGHEVQHFGMEHPDRIVGNDYDLYTREMDFHGAGLFEKLRYPLQIVRSKEAYQKLLIVLKKFRPDVVHINNFNYQLTPSILEALERYRKVKPSLKVVFTAHDGQLCCPSHMLYQPKKKNVCMECTDGKYLRCIKNRCIHESAARSLFGTMEAYYWHKKHIYRSFDHIVCPSAFLKSVLDTDPDLAKKTMVLHNFANTKDIPEEKVELSHPLPEKYVLFFGRYAIEKGIDLVLDVMKKHPELTLVCAGSGALKEEINKLPNVLDMGFCNAAQLKMLIEQAAFTVLPSVWYENCPFSVIESIMYGTPVLGAKIGGIPELIQAGTTGQLFKAGSKKELEHTLLAMWEEMDTKQEWYRKNCLTQHFINLDEYVAKVLELYKG